MRARIDAGDLRRLRSFQDEGRGVVDSIGDESGSASSFALLKEEANAFGDEPDAGACSFSKGHACSGFKLRFGPVHHACGGQNSASCHVPYGICLLMYLLRYTVYVQVETFSSPVEGVKPLRGISEHVGLGSIMIASESFDLTEA